MGKNTSAYFRPETLKFLQELERNNTRDWFNENKARYETDVLDVALGQPARDVAVVDSHNWLIEDSEFVSCQRAAKVIFEAEGGDHLLVHLVIEDRKAVATHRLGAVHRSVRVT